MKNSKNWSLIKYKISMLTGVIALATIPNIAAADSLTECIVYENGDAACANGTDATSSNPQWKALIKSDSSHKLANIQVYENKISALGKKYFGSLKPYVYRYNWESHSAAPSADRSSAVYDDSIWYGTSSNAISCTILHNRDIDDWQGMYGFSMCDPGNIWSNGSRAYALAGSKAWRIAINGTLGYIGNILTKMNKDEAWTTIPGPNSGTLQSISVDYKTFTVCGSNSSNQIFCADNPNNEGTNITWRQISGVAKSVSVYKGRLWRVGTDGKVYYKPDTTTTDNWVAQGNSNVVMVAVSGTGDTIPPPAGEENLDPVNNPTNVCVRNLGTISCANDRSITSNAPTMNNLLEPSEHAYYQTINIHQNNVIVRGDISSPINSFVFDWENLSATPTSTEDTDSINSKAIIWIGAGTNRTTNKIYQCRVHFDGSISCKDKDSSTWIDIASTKQFKHLALANSHIWGIATDNTIWYKESYATSTNDWAQVTGGLSNLAVDYTTNTICGTSSANAIYCADWPANKGAGVVWRQVPGVAISVAVFDGKMWSIGNDKFLYYKSNTTTTGSWKKQNISEVLEVVASGTAAVTVTDPLPSDQKIHACVRYLNGSAACANGDSAYTATPTMVNLSKISDANRISMLNIDRHYPVGLGATTSISNAIYDWSGVGATPTISSDSNAAGQKVVWLGSGVNIANSKVYQCRALEDGKVSCKDKDAATWLDLAHSTTGFKHLALANSHIWGIAKDNTIWYKRSYLNAANDWVLVPGILVNLTVDYKTNTICGNNTANDIYCADWPSNTGSGVGWRGIAGKANSVAVFEKKMWIVGTDNYLYYKPDTSSNGNWVKTNVSSLAQVTVSGISDISSGIDLESGLTWKAQGDKFVSFTTNKQDVQCASNDGRTCLTNITLEQAKQSTTPLVCGAMLKAVTGITGYNTSGHWCHTAANGWIWSPQVGGLFWRMTSGGDPQCAAADGRNCFWWSGHNLEWVVSAATRPLTCGNNHFWQYWTTGYKPGHWCKYLKDNSGSSTLW